MCLRVTKERKEGLYGKGRVKKRRKGLILPLFKSLKTKEKKKLRVYGVAQEFQLDRRNRNGAKSPYRYKMLPIQVKCPKQTQHKWNFLKGGINEKNT